MLHVLALVCIPVEMSQCDLVVTPTLSGWTGVTSDASINSLTVALPPATAG